MNSRTKVFFGVLALLVVSASLLFAQHDHGAAQGASSDTMQGHHTHRSEMMSLMDQMSKTLADARELSNPDEMRAAIEKAQSQLAEIKQHMNMNHMAMDGMMHDSHGQMHHSNCGSNQQ